MPTHDPYLCSLFTLLFDLYARTCLLPSHGVYLPARRSLEGNLILPPSGHGSSVKAT